MKARILLVALAAVTCLTLPACQPNKSTKTQQSKTTNVQQTKQKEKKTMVTEMTTEMFRERVMDYKENATEWKYKGTKPAVIDFYATWCGPCRMISPRVAKMAEKYDGKVDFYKVDVDQQEELAALFGIQSIPTLIFIPTDGLPQKSVGAISETQLESTIKDSFKL